MPGPVTCTALLHFCPILPGTPEGGYDHQPVSQMRRVRVTPVVCAWLVLQAVLNRCGSISSGANLHFPGGRSGGAALHMFLEHLECLSCEVPLHVACLFFPWAACVFIFCLFELNPRFWRRAFVLRCYTIFSQSAACLCIFSLSFDEQKCLILM